MRYTSCLIFTVDELRNSLRPTLENIAKSQIPEAIRGNEGSKRSIIDILDFNHWSIKQLADAWAELCSEVFFATHSGVGCALLETGKGDYEWLANRE